MKPDRDPQKQPGFAPGKRVWLRADTWDGALLAKKHGSAADKMRVVPGPDEHHAYGRVTVRLADGTETAIPKDLLRLTPPPSLSGRNERTKETKPPVRKEAIDPALGTETTIFDHLETT